MNALAWWLMRHPLIAVALHLAVTVVLAAFGLGIRFDNAVGSLRFTDHPDAVFYERARAEFGSDDVAVIGVGAYDLFTVQTIEKIARVTDALASLDGVERVVSLTNAPDPTATSGSGAGARLLPRVPPSPSDLARLRQKIESIPLYRDHLVARDLRGAAIHVFFKPLSDVEYRDFQIDRRIEEILAAARGTFHHSGTLHLRQAAADLMRAELLRLTPMAMAVMTAVMWLCFWSVRGVVFAALSVGMALVWTLGLMVLAGRSLSLGTMVLPPLLIVIGSVYAIHVLARYVQRSGEDVEGEGSAARLAGVMAPVTLSALTTMVGFASLMLSPVAMVRDLGLFASVGVFFCAVSSLTFLPAALRLSGLWEGAGITSAIAEALTRVLTWLGGRAHVWRRGVRWTAGGIAVLALAGAARIHVDSNLLASFEPLSKVRRDSEIVNERIAGAAPFFIVMDAGEAGAVMRWEVLRQIKKLQAFVAALPGVRSTLSIADYIDLYGGGDVPWSDAARVEALAVSIGSGQAPLGAVVSDDLRRASIVVRSALSSSSEVENTLAAIEAYVAQNLPASLRVRPTGNLVLLVGSTSEVVAAQMRSLALALLVIFAVLAVMFLSVRIGFLAVIPNAVAILVFFGIMGWSGISLNLATSLIAAIALGVAVDSTVHYLWRLNTVLKNEADPAAASIRSLHGAGPSLVLATTALVVGFLTFTYSDFVPFRELGALAAGTMVAALAGNLVLLPALMAGTKVITLWDLVAVRLGEDPARTIPLFRGVGAAEARIVVLMGELGHFRAGETIVRRGECGSDMYVILEGKARVMVDKMGVPAAIAELQRGDVFGEMAVVRHDARSADVVACGPVEVLAFSQRCFERLQDRYPRIAAKLLLNLSRILADRLQRMTESKVEVERQPLPAPGAQ